MVDIAISTVDLRKTYRYGRATVAAVDGISLDIAPGEFFGLLGPNGAGKSTTIGMLTTRVAPTAGRAYVAGVDVARHPVQVRQRVGVVTQKNTMDRQISALENLEFRGRYFGMSRRAARRRGLALLTEFGVADKADSSMDHLSGGQARRVMICRALMNRPSILVLDEPTAGVDPQTRLHLWELLRSLHAAGQTILLTTHYLDEAEALCRRIGIIDKGRLLTCGSLADITATAGAEAVVTVDFDGAAEAAVEIATKIDAVTDVTADGHRLRVSATTLDGLVGELATIGTNCGLSIRDVSSLPPSLETAFLNLTGREFRE
jgi:ABC-2 type transport system ATP-binding protein